MIPVHVLYIISISRLTLHFILSFLIYFTIQAVPLLDRQLDNKYANCRALIGLGTDREFQQGLLGS